MTEKRLENTKNRKNEPVQSTQKSHWKFEKVVDCKEKVWYDIFNLINKLNNVKRIEIGLIWKLFAMIGLKWLREKKDFRQGGSLPDMESRF